MAAAGKALAAIQELMKRGVSPNEVYRQTGMKQGIDGKWAVPAVVGIGATAQSEQAEASFIGKLAKTFKWDAHTLAKKLEDSGADRDEIWKQTGEQFGTPLYRGNEGKWRQEASDEALSGKPYQSTPDEAIKDARERAFIDDDAQLRERVKTMAKYRGRTTDSLLAEYKASGEKIADAAMESPEKAMQMMDDRRGLDQLFGEMGSKDYGPMSSYITNDELFKAYPDLAEMHTRISPDDLGGARGQYIAGGGYKAEQIGLAQKPRGGAPLSTAAHELQHTIQEREGFAAGGSPQMAIDAVDEYKKELYAPIEAKIDSVRGSQDYMKRMFKLKQEGLRKSERQRIVDKEFGIDKLMIEQGEIADRVSRMKGYDYMTSQNDPYQAYRRLTGEAESRNVQTRLPYSMEQRIAAPPWSTLDVPENELINRFRSVAPYATTGGLLGLGALSPDTARASSTGTIEAAKYPMMQTAADYMDKIELPIVGRPLQGIADWARGVAYDDPDKLKRAAIGALDLM